MIPFNQPLYTGRERAYLDEALASRKLAGAGTFSKRCNAALEAIFAGGRAFVTTSGTHALEMAALLCDLEPGDEVIVPSYAFPTTASAFARCGATLVFVDVDPATMNVDPCAVARAVTDRTRVIVALHYGGVSCDMEALGSIAASHGLIVVEDAAQALGARYGERACGGVGTFGCISFHESKNVHCGEGGALICNEPRHAERAEIVLEKGTNRGRFFRGQVDKYTWQALGSSYVLSELNAAFLLAQLEALSEVTEDRRRTWTSYRELLDPLVGEGLIEVAHPPPACRHNGHLFWLKTRDAEAREWLMRALRERGVQTVFHYQPLHNSPAGLRHGRFAGKDRHTTWDAARLLRLPMYFGLRETGTVADALAAILR